VDRHCGCAGGGGVRVGGGGVTKFTSAECARARDNECGDA
jgi:hypothetical protein